MGKRAAKHKQRYVDRPGDRYKLICPIHVHGHSSEQCKALNDFGTHYSTGRPFEEHRHKLTSAEQKNKH